MAAGVGRGGSDSEFPDINVICSSVSFPAKPIQGKRLCCVLPSDLCFLASVFLAFEASRQKITSKWPIYDIYDAMDLLHAHAEKVEKVRADLRGWNLGRAMFVWPTPG